MSTRTQVVPKAAGRGGRPATYRDRVNLSFWLERDLRERLHAAAAAAGTTAGEVLLAAAQDFVRRHSPEAGAPAEGAGAST